MNAHDYACDNDECHSIGGSQSAIKPHPAAEHFLSQNDEVLFLLHKTDKEH